MAFSIELQTKYNVLIAESGEQCIEKYLDAKHSGRKIDLILLDYKLGDIVQKPIAIDSLMAKVAQGVGN